MSAMIESYEAEKNTQIEAFYQHKELLVFGKIAYIDDSPQISKHFLYKHILEYVNIYEDLENIDLLQFSAIVLPMGIDEYYLSKFKDKITHFLDSGGVVFSFMSDFAKILPYSSGYIQSQMSIRERVVQFAKSESAKIIFNGVREYDINHRRGVKGFFNRGYFDVSTFPYQVEWILTDNANQCVGYVDRHSTNGVILSTANADLLSFGLFDNTTARVMGTNLLKWLLKTLQEKDYKHLRNKAISFTPKQSLKGIAQDYVNDFFHFKSDKKQQSLSNPQLKNAIITGGSSFHRYFFTNKNEKYAHFFSNRYHFLDLDSIHLEKFDYIVLASRLKPNYLTKYKDKFLSYLQNGGHIVSFGEIMGDYLPNVVWKDYPVNFWWWLIQGANMPLYALESNGSKQEKHTKSGLFSKIEVSTAKWHYHGAFYPPSNATKILINELDESIIYKDNSFRGNLYITSLDPEFHLGQGFMPTTEPFFDNFMQWVEEDIMQSEQK